MRAFRMTKTLTSGNPAKLIFLFTIPLLIGNLFQQFYNMADTLIVGRTLGVEALAAVGCTGGLMFFILGFVIGFTAGLAIITAQRFGAGRRRAVRRSFAVCIVLSSVMTVLLTAVSVAFARPVLELCKLLRKSWRRPTPTSSSFPGASAQPCCSTSSPTFSAPSGTAGRPSISWFWPAY